MNSKQRRRDERRAAAANASAIEQSIGLASVAQASGGDGALWLPNSSQVLPFQSPPIVETTPDKVVVRTAAVSIVMPFAVWAGRLQNPDTVLRQFGGFYGTAFYRLMQQQNLSLSADCSQWEDRVNAIDRRIKPGVSKNPISEQMAKDCRSIFRRLQNSNIINLWILRARFYGFAAIGLAGWKKDPETGVLAPFDVYNVEPWRIKFGPNGEAFLATQLNAFGSPIPQGVMFFPRWGSLFTPYGESDLRDVYLSSWYMQTIEDMLLQSIEILGRPIPWIEVGDQLQGDEFDKFEAGIARQYKHYVITRTPNAKTSTSFPNLTVLANGAAGRSELEFIRYHAGLISRKILGTQQTQDKTGGSRALEDTRMEIAHDKTPPGSQLLDSSWTSGFLDQIGFANWANQPRELWPIMDSSAGIGGVSLDGRTMLAIGALADQLRLKQITPTWAQHVLVSSGAFDENEAEDMVNSMIAENADLSMLPANQQAVQTSGTETQ